MFQEKLLSERGATMLESAMTLPFLIVFLTVTFDLLRLSYCALALQYTASTVMREVTLSSMSADDIQNRVITYASGLGIQLTAENVSLCPIASFPCAAGVITPVASQRTAVLSIDRPMTGFMVNALSIIGLNRVDINIHAMATGRIEPK